MARDMELIQLGESSEQIQRIVNYREVVTTLGIEIGRVQFRLDDTPVWRPANPRALGLNRSWTEGVWRNVYRVSMAPIYGRAECAEPTDEFEIDGLVFSLPRVEFEVSPALVRYLKQHLR